MGDNSSSNKRLAKNTVFLSVRMVIVLLISFFTTRVVLDELGVVDYGVYNVVCGFVSMFAFLNTSISNGIQRFYNFEFGKNGEEGANRVYCTSINIQALLAFSIVVVIEVVGLWYLHNKMKIPLERIEAAEWIFQFAVFSFVMGIMQAPFSAAVTAHEKFDFFAIVSVLDAILKLGIVFMIKIVPFDKLIIYGFLLTIISVINFALYFVYCKKNFKEIRYHFGIDKTLFNKMLGFSGWNLFGTLSGVMKEQGINLVLNFFFGPVINAARGVAQQVNSGIQGFVGNILTPVRPQVIQSYAQSNLERALNLTYSISKISSCFFLLMAIPISLEIDFVLKLWLGDNIPEHTDYFTTIVIATSLINILNGAISTIVHATGKMKKYQLWGSLIGISSVPITFYLFKLYPVPEIALLVVFACSVISHIVGLFIVKGLVGMPLLDYWKKVIVPIVIVFMFCVSISFLVHIFMNESALRFLFVISSSAISISIATYLFALNKTERCFVKEQIKKTIRHYCR